MDTPAVYAIDGNPSTVNILYYHQVNHMVRYELCPRESSVAFNWSKYTHLFQMF